MPLSSNTSVVLPQNEVVLGIFPGGNNDFTGNWPQARIDLETWVNTGGVTGHRFKMLHGIVGNSWNSGSYYNTRTMWQGLPSDVQPLISIPSMFPQSDPSDGHLNTSGTGASPGAQATYDKANLGAYDYYYNLVFGQIAADYPYASLRVGQEIDGNWFYWGLGNNTVSGNASYGNLGTPGKAAQLHTKLSRMAKAAGWKGTWEVNCGTYNGLNISSILDSMSPSDWDIAGCDAYAERITLSDSQTTAWNTKQQPMIANAQAMAAKYGKAWAMSEWGPVTYVDGSPDYGCDDDSYYMQQVRATAVDPTKPRCAYLALFNGNDWNSNGTMHRRDAMANPASISSGPWSDDSHFPNAIKELKGSDYTPAGLTRYAVTPTPTPTNPTALAPKRLSRARMIYAH